MLACGRSTTPFENWPRQFSAPDAGQVTIFNIFYYGKNQVAKILGARLHEPLNNDSFADDVSPRVTNLILNS